MKIPKPDRSELLDLIISLVIFAIVSALLTWAVILVVN